jgi:hypothetical protein
MGADTKPITAGPTPLGVARALERLRQVRVMEAEALAELITAIMAVELTNGACDGPAASGKFSLSASSLSATPCYLSVKQLAARIPYAEKTLRNLMLAGELVEGRHFFKRRGRVMFSWLAMCDWVEKRETAAATGIPLVRNRRHGPSF